MRPIRELNDIETGRVLYHSAFGFARVENVRPVGVSLSWDGEGDNLPDAATHDVLQRVYALCPADGFFHRSVNDRPAHEALIEEHPADGLALTAVHRDLTRDDTGALCAKGGRWNLDHVWFSRDEARAWLPVEPALGVSHVLPQALAER